jgi:hypothetical protein
MTNSTIMSLKSNNLTGWGGGILTAKLNNLTGWGGGILTAKLNHLTGGDGISRETDSKIHTI